MRTISQLHVNGRASQPERWNPFRPLATFDRPGWRRFFLALFGLSFAFLLSLLSAALNFSGNPALGHLCALLSLILAGIVAIKIVPYLARRTALERWMVKIEYEFTIEGAIYLVLIAVIIVAALNTGNNLLFIILASLLAGILVSGILSKIVLEDLELDFALPEHLFARQPMISRLTLRNLKMVSALLLRHGGGPGPGAEKGIATCGGRRFAHSNPGRACLPALYPATLFSDPARGIRLFPAAGDIHRRVFASAPNFLLGS